jgi:hypothetical protein
MSREVAHLEARQAEELEQEQRKNRQLAKELEKMKAQLKEVKELEKSKPKVNVENAMKLQRCNDMELSIRKAVKDHLWCMTKFISDPEQKETAAREVYKLLELATTKENNQAYECSWIRTYQDYVVKAINEKRSYAQTEMKKSALLWAKEHGGDLPSEKEILACATRSCANEEVFKWYWDKLIPNVIGHGQFGPNVRYYQMMSLAKTKENGKPGKQLVTASSEAFTVLLYENCRTKWIAIYNWCQKNPNAKPGKGLFRPQKDGIGIEFKSRYTEQDIGQAEFGGWSQQGLQRYQVLKDLILTARKALGKKILQKEKPILDQLRTDNNLSCVDHETERKSKRKRAKNTIENGDDIGPAAINVSGLGEEEEDFLNLSGDDATDDAGEDDDQEQVDEDENGEDSDGDADAE